MKPLHLVLAFAAVACAQKPLKSGKKPAYLAHSPGGPAGLPVESAPAYHGGSGSQGSVSNHGFGGGHGGSNSFSGIGKEGSKPVYPLLLSDTRTLNPDGTINFDYKADNGLHQGETVDSDGTRRGFYSYPGADGKLITVKYTAGKNGFVAEGPHLPKQPQAAPYNPKQQQDDIYSSNKGSHFGGHGGGHFSQASPLGGHGGAYRQGGAALSGHGGQANHYAHSSGLGQGQNAFANFPDFSSQFPSAGSGHGGSYSSGGAGRYQGAGAGSGAALSGIGGGSHHSGHPGGSSSFASLQGLGSTGNAGGSNVNLADIGSSLGGFSGPTFTANNPYQPTLAAANPSNPVNAAFDLGNSGHFSINFTPGAGQEYNPNEINGDYGSSSLGGHQGGAHGGAAYSGASGHGAAAQGRY